MERRRTGEKYKMNFYIVISVCMRVPGSLSEDPRNPSFDSFAKPTLMQTENAAL